MSRATTIGLCIGGLIGAFLAKAVWGAGPEFTFMYLLLIIAINTAREK